MATYTQGNTTIMLTAEGAAKANELNKNGLTVKVTHMRIYRTPTPVQEIPYQFTGLENKDTLAGWSALPNADTAFDVIENYPTVPMFGYMTLIGTLGAEVGTFSYDAVGLFLEDETLYAICTTSRLLTKRKAAIGTTSNIQELSFNITHSTVDEITDFQINERIIDYTKITEIQFPHELPKAYDRGERVYRITTGTLQTYTDKDAFVTTLASQCRMTLDGVKVPLWILSDYVRLFDSLLLEYTILPDNKVQVSIPASAEYPVELISTSRTFVLSLADPNNLVEYSTLRLQLDVDATDATGFNFVFDILDTTVNVTDPIKLRGILATRSDDGIYQDAIKTAIRQMTEIQYSAGRHFKSDGTTNPNTLLLPYWNRESTWLKLDNRVEAATSIYDSRLYTPGMMQPIINKPGSVDHMTLRASNIWINTDNAVATPTLTIDNMMLFYGQNAIATVTAPGVKDGSRIAWYVESPRPGALTTPTRTYGYVEIQNGVGTFDIKPDWLVVLDNDAIPVGLVGYPDQDTLIVIKQLVVESYFSSDAEGLVPINFSDEGVAVFYNVKVTDEVPVDVILYNRIGAGSTAANDDIDGLFPDYIHLVGTHSSIELQLKNDEFTEGGETLIIETALTEAFSKVLTSATLGINDTSLTRNPTFEVYFAYDIAGLRAIPTGTPVGLGTGNVYLIVKATDVPSSYNVTIDWSGTLDLVEDVNLTVPNPLDLTLVNGFVAYPISTKAPQTTTPTDPGGSWEVKELKITADRYTTYSLYEEFVNAFGAPKTNSSVKLTINSGVTVVGTATTTPAIDCTGNWPAGVQIVIENDGNIYGLGGRGGYIDRTTPYNGENGGFAILAQQANPVTVNNRGTVAGGGGGSGAAFHAYKFPNQFVTRGFMQNGHGGRPLGAAATGGVMPNGYTTGSPFPGVSGTLTDPGSSPNFAIGSSDIGPMSGGDLAQAGTSGKGNTRNSNGGAAGFATYGPVTIAGGTVLGAAG